MEVGRGVLLVIGWVSWNFRGRLGYGCYCYCVWELFLGDVLKVRVLNEVK